MQSEILSDNSNIIRDEYFYDEFAIKDWLSEVEALLLIHKLNPHFFEKYEPKKMFILNLARGVYTRYDCNLNKIPETIPSRLILDSRSPGFLIPDDLKEIITKDFVKTYVVLNLSSESKVRLSDANEYSRRHPFIVIREAYAKRCIDENHPFLKCVNKRYERQTGEYLIQVAEPSGISQKKSDQWRKFYTDKTIRNNDFLDRANKLRHGGEKKITTIQSKLEQQEVGRTNITLSALKKIVTKAALQNRRQQYSK